MSLQLNCKTAFGDGRTCFGPRLFFPPTTQCHHLSFPWRREFKAGWGSFYINAGAGFSRRRQKRASTGKPKGHGSGPKGFVPRSPNVTSNQKRDKKSTTVKGGSSTSPVSEISRGNQQTLDVKIDADEEEAVESSQENFFEVVDANDEINGEAGQLWLLHDKPGVVLSNLGGENGNVSIIDEVDVLDTSNIGNVEYSEEKPLDYAKIDGNVSETNVDTDDEVTGETIGGEINTGTEDKINEEASLLFKLELEANLRRQDIERIAEENFSVGNKLFVYPPVVKPDQYIEVFLNRSLSTLNNEPDVLIIGAFNDWRWKSFTVRLNKTHLSGDWWSCQIHVPREVFYR